MRTHRNAADLFTAQKKRFSSVVMSVKKMHEEIALAGLDDGKELTSGTTSTAQLRRLGHPFARRLLSGQFGGRSRGFLKPLPINEQSGRLKAGLFLIHSRRNGNQTFDLGSSAPYSKYILSPLGTSKMVGRGFWAEISKRWKARNAALVVVWRKQSRM